jgi:serine/threonine protein kinase
METEFIDKKVLFNKLNDYLKDNIGISFLTWGRILIIITKEDLFYCIDIWDENIASFILNDDNSVIQSMIVKGLCYKRINDIGINYWSKYCFARNTDEYKIYYYDIKYGVIKEYISEQKIIDMCCCETHSILLTQCGKVYEYKDVMNEDERKKNDKYIHFELKSFKNYSFENNKIVMISCGLRHSLALTESGRVFGWGSNWSGQLGVGVRHSSEPTIIKLNYLKIKKISCGAFHNLLLSYDGDIYAFGWNGFGEVGNGTRKEQRLPIKLELNKKFIDIASHPDYGISMSQSIDGIYYVWGVFEGKQFLSPQSTKYESFEEILASTDFLHNIKTFDKLIEFKDSFVENGFYSKYFEEIEKLGSGSFGSVFKVKRREDSDYYRSRREYSAIKRIEFTSVVEKDEMFKENLNYRIITRNCSNYEYLVDYYIYYYRRYKTEFSAIKRIELTSEVSKDEMIREYLNYKVITKNYSKNEYLVKHFDAWFEESVVKNVLKISLYIQMELCDQTLNDVIKELTNDSTLKSTESLTKTGYYIASQIFIQILEGVNHLHKQNPPLIHRDLKPANILLKKDDSKGVCVKIADIGLAVIHKYSEQSHTLDKGTPKYMAPEVINSGKYNTKADIYSLGVTLQNLFALDMNE